MLTPKEIEKANAFWKWFEKNRFGFEFLSDVDSSEQNSLLNACGREMEKFCEGLNPVVSPEITRKGGLRLVVSALGEHEYFQQAKDLVSLAPEFPNWTIYALIPPLEKGIQIRFSVEGIKLDPMELGVALADVGGYPNHLGILVGLRDYDTIPPEMMPDVRSTVIKLISNICGEEMVAYDIQFFDLRPLPENPHQHGYSQLIYLPQLIQEYRLEQPSPVLEKIAKDN